MPTEPMQAILREHGGLRDRLANAILAHPAVAEASRTVQTSGITLPQIIATVLPFALQYLLTHTIDIQAVVAAILALAQPKA